MGEKTNITWADSTASPWGGCRKRSTGCLNCYIPEAPPLRFRGYKLGEPRVRFTGFEALARKLNRKAGDAHFDWAAATPYAQRDPKTRPSRPRIFPSLMDWLDEEVLVEWLANFLRVVYECQHLDWLLLTKRPELWRSRIMTAIASKTDGTGKDGDFWQWMVSWGRRNCPEKHLVWRDRGG